jgi:hypothetical protein
MSGKGSRPRPYSVDQKTFADNWDAIFKKKDKPDSIEDIIKSMPFIENEEMWAMRIIDDGNDTETGC